MIWLHQKLLKEDNFLKLSFPDIYHSTNFKADTTRNVTQFAQIIQLIFMGIKSLNVILSYYTVNKICQRLREWNQPLTQFEFIFLTPNLYVPLGDRYVSWIRLKWRHYFIIWMPIWKINMKNILIYNNIRKFKYYKYYKQITNLIY